MSHTHPLLRALLSSTLSLALLASLLPGCAKPTPSSPNKSSTQPTTFQSFTPPEIISVATYNVENWRNNFEAERLQRSGASVSPELLRLLRAANDENNWEVSQVLLELSPSIVLFQEAASLDDLKFFNTRWLNNAYETIHVFTTNSGRGQNLALFLKPGFKILELREDYYKEPDPNPTGRTAGGDESGPAGQPPRLFARGPGFALIQTPTGHKLWVGNTHQKSKSGNSVEVTQWRNREAARTLAILKELKSTGHPVIFTGDFNDELGIQEFEAEAGGSTIEINVGSPADGFFLATQSLHDQKLNSYQGYFRDRFRSLIDHFVISADLKPALTNIRIDRSTWAQVASDHFPVIATFDLRKLPTTPPLAKP